MASPVRVAIVTSDGYEAWGIALDAVRAATDYTLVDTFTRFLERRVMTENLELLRRMAAEFFCHCETTVREFIAQGSLQISVGPLDAEAYDAVAVERLLSQPRSLAACERSLSLFAFLSSRLRSVRMPLLTQWFTEFCRGDDASLRQFISKGDGFVSLLPLVAAPSARLAFAPPDTHPFESVDPLPMPMPPGWHMKTTPRNQAQLKAQEIYPLSGQKRKAIGTPLRFRDLEEQEKTAALDMGDQDDHGSKSDSDESGSLAFEGNFKHPDDTIKARIVDAVRKLEQTEPWTKVFTETQPLPFDEAAFPQLARKFRTFWSRYGRAVWERRFSCPFVADRDHNLRSRRQDRQRNAAKSFRKLIRECFELFGARFFYKLDRKRHPGWWYRDMCVDLLGLSTIVGYDKCIEYVKTQQHERFPNCGQPLPLPTANSGIIQSRRELVMSNALWLHTSKPGVDDMEKALTAYIAKKNKKKQLKKTAAKTISRPKAGRIPKRSACSSLPVAPRSNSHAGEKAMEVMDVLA